MKRLLLVPIVALLALFAAACGSDDSVDSGASQSQGPGGEWVLDSLVLEGDMAIPLPDQPLNLRIDGDQLGGDAGCNSMGGSATFAGDGDLTIGDLFWTEMACADNSLMTFEQQYTQAITGMTSWSLDGDRLTLRSDVAQATYFPRIAPADLPIVGTTWTLDTFFDGDAAMNAAGMDEVQVVFSAAGVDVSGRCWTIPGFATIEPGGEGNLTMEFGDPDFTCDDRAFFEEMVQRLSATNEYRITESRLWVGASGRDLLSMTGS